MALQFNVSLEAMAHRIDNLGMSDRLPADTHRAVST
jgi:hypothetical protein